MQQQDRFLAEDFFEDYDDRQPYTDGSLAVEAVPVEVPERLPKRNPRVGQNKSKKPTQRTKWKIRKADEEEMVRIKSKFNFFLCAAFVLAGCLTIVASYIQVFNREAEISRLQSQLAEAQAENTIAVQAAEEQMTMEQLYGFATGELGMVEADGTTTIRVKVESQSYTSSSLPVQRTSEGKVSFHWFG